MTRCQLSRKVFEPPKTETFLRSILLKVNDTYQQIGWQRPAADFVNLLRLRFALILIE